MLPSKSHRQRPPSHSGGKGGETLALLKGSGFFFFFHVKPGLTFKITVHVGITLTLKRVRVANRY